MGVVYFEILNTPFTLPQLSFHVSCSVERLPRVPFSKMTDAVPPAGEEAQNPLDAGGPYLVKLKGLPFDVTKTAIVQFLHDCTIKDGNDGVHILLGADCRATGEALVSLASHMDMVKALNHDRNHIGSRYVEVMYITQEQFDDDLKSTSNAASSGDFLVRLRGLPYSAQVKDVINLLHDCKLKNNEQSVKFCFVSDGRPSGECYVELCSMEDVERALGHSRENVGRRYVEIFRGLKSQMEWDTKSREEKMDGPNVVRLRGLPYGCTIDQITDFMTGITIAPGGITFKFNSDGSESGMAFVELNSNADVENALARNRNKIQHRYIEVFRSSESEVRPYKSGGRPTPYMRPGEGGFVGGGTLGGDKYGSGYERSYRGRGGGGRGRGVGYGGGGGGDGAYYENQGYFANPTAQAQYPQQGADPNQFNSYPNATATSYATATGYVATTGDLVGTVAAIGTALPSNHGVRMRGLPWSAKEKDITDFFQPLAVVKVVMSFDQLGRPSGDAEVYFSSHEDAVAAMQKNRQHIGKRYVELFLNSPASVPQYAANATSIVQNPSSGVEGYSNNYMAQQPITYAQPQQQQQQQQQQPYQTSSAGYSQAGVTYQQGGAGAVFGQQGSVPQQAAIPQQANNPQQATMAQPQPQQWTTSY